MRKSLLSYIRLAVLALCASFIFPATLFSAQTMNINLGSRDFTLSPLHAYASSDAFFFSSIYLSLFTFDPQTLAPIWDAGASETHSADRTKYTFTLKPNLKFSDGSAITAQDFVDSWLLMISPQSKAEYGGFFDIIKGARAYRNGTARRSAVQISAPDARTFKIELSRPVPYLFSLLANYSFAVLPPTLRAALQKSGGAKGLRPGDIAYSGPYAVASSDGKTTVLVKNKEYWDAQNVFFDKVNFLGYDDPKSVTKQFNQGRIDWGLDIFAPKAVSNTDAVRLSLLDGTSYLFFNSKDSAFQDARLRRAMVEMLPMEHIRGYYGRLGAQSLLLGSKAQPQHQNTSDAMELLKKSGHAHGRGLSDMALLVPDGMETDPGILLAKKTWKKNLKIPVTIKTVPEKDYFDALSKGDYTVAFTSWMADFPDPMALLQTFEATNPFNLGHYKSADFDRLLQKSFSLGGKNSAGARLKVLQQAEQILLTEDPAVVPLFYSVAYNLIDTNFIGGWYSNPLDIHPLKFLRRKSYSIPGSV